MDRTEVEIEKLKEQNDNDEEKQSDDDENNIHQKNQTQLVREHLKDENDVNAIPENILKAVGITQNMTGLPRDSHFKVLPDGSFLWIYNLEKAGLKEEIKLSEDVWKKHMQSIKYTDVHENRFPNNDYFIDLQNAYLDLHFKKQQDMINPYCAWAIMRTKIYNLIHTRGRHPEHWVVIDFYCKRNSEKNKCPMSGKIKINFKYLAEIHWTGSKISHHTGDEMSSTRITESDKEQYAQYAKLMAPKAIARKEQGKYPSGLLAMGFQGPAMSAKAISRWSYKYKPDELQGIHNESVKLMLFHEKAIEVDKARNPSTVLPGILQTLQILPKLRLTLYNERQIRVYHEVVKADILYIDATGGIIKSSKKNLTFNSRCLTYKLVVRNPVERQPSLTVSELVSCSHYIEAIETWLKEFLRNERQIFKKNNIPCLIMTDFSLAIIIAVCHSFGNESFGSYTRRCLKIITGNATQITDFNFFLHSCTAHVMKNAKILVKKYYKKHSKFGMFLIGLLISSINWEEVCSIMKNICILLTSTNVTTQTKKALAEIEKELKTLHQKTDTDGTDDEEFDECFTKFSTKSGSGEMKRMIQNDIDSIEKIERDEQANYEEVYEEVLISGKPFVELLNNQLLSTITMITNENQAERIAVEANKYQSNEFFGGILTQIISAIHLYSGMFLGNVAAKYGTSKHMNDPGNPYFIANKRYEKIEKYGKTFRSIMSDNRTQGIVEQAMFSYKHIDKKFNSRFANPSDYCAHYSTTVHATLNEYAIGLTKKKRTKNGKDTSRSKFKEPEEGWRKVIGNKPTASPYGRYTGTPKSDLKIKSAQQTHFKTPEVPEKEEKKVQDKKKDSTRRRLHFSNETDEHFGIENSLNNCWFSATVQALGFSKLLDWYSENSESHNMDWMGRISELFADLRSSERTDAFAQSGSFAIFHLPILQLLFTDAFSVCNLKNTIKLNHTIIQLKSVSTKICFIHHKIIK
jgi:hypothetical protein